MWTNGTLATLAVFHFLPLKKKYRRNGVVLFASLVMFVSFLFHADNRFFCALSRGAPICPPMYALISVFGPVYRYLPHQAKLGMSHSSYLVLYFRVDETCLFSLLSPICHSSPLVLISCSNLARSRSCPTYILLYCSYAFIFVIVPMSSFTHFSLKFHLPNFLSSGKEASMPMRLHCGLNKIRRFQKTKN